MATLMLDAGPAPLALTLFGPMRILVEGRELPRLRSRKTQWLLALLALRHGRPVEREWLAGTLWPDIDQDQAFANMRPVLSELRKALGSQGSRIQSPNRHVLRLDVSGADVDVAAFDAAIARKTLSALEQAVALYRGPLLEGCAEEWIGQERGAREQDCLQALGTLAKAARAIGDHAAAVGYYRQATGIDPWREAARRGMMEALAESGDRNAALQVYREFAELLKSDPTAVPDEETSALYARLRTETRRRAAPRHSIAEEPDAQDAATPVVSGYLPHPVTDLVGREDERAEVRLRLRRSRLVTLTGPGGIGKTRLALAVAAEAASDYRNGVLLVAFDSLSDPSLFARQIAVALGLKEEAARSYLMVVAEHLREKHLLLVLDNCEHLLEAAAQVAGHLLRECYGVRILATSREALRIPGETAWAVPGLPVPDLATLPTGQATLRRVLMGYEGVQLFVERAQAAQKTFSLTGGNALAVAQVCCRLEGLPLAVELAAARVKAMSVEQIAARLDDHLGLLTGGSRAGQSRQQTLRATLDWSYQLLSEDERLLAARLSVFSGGWSLEAAESACGGDGIEAAHVLDLLTALVDKSLVIFEQAGPEAGGRYRLLEMVRQYAAERLAASGAAERVKAKHRDWFLEFAEAFSNLGLKKESALPSIETEHDNLRAALAWCKDDAQGAESELRLVGSLWPFWHMRGYVVEGRRHLEQALAREGAKDPTAARATALRAAAAMMVQQGDYAAAKLSYEECLSIVRHVGSRSSVAAALNGLGNAYTSLGDYETARTYYEESLEIARDLGDSQHIAWSLSCLGKVVLSLGDSVFARTLYEESLMIRRNLGTRFDTAMSLLGLGNATRDLGDHARAWELLEESLSIFREVDGKLGIVPSLNSLGSVAFARGDLASARAHHEEALALCRELIDQDEIERSLRGLGFVMSGLSDPGRASRLLGAAEALRERVGSRILLRERADYERQVEQVRAAFGEDAFRAAWNAGSAMTWSEAVAYALEE